MRLRPALSTQDLTKFDERARPTSVRTKWNVLCESARTGQWPPVRRPIQGMTGPATACLHRWRLRTRCRMLGCSRLTLMCRTKTCVSSSVCSIEFGNWKQSCGPRSPPLRREFRSISVLFSTRPLCHVAASLQPGGLRVNSRGLRSRPWKALDRMSHIDAFVRTPPPAPRHNPRLSQTFSSSALPCSANTSPSSACARFVSRPNAHSPLLSPAFVRTTAFLRPFMDRRNKPFTASWARFSLGPWS